MIKDFYPEAWAMANNPITVAMQAPNGCSFVVTDVTAQPYVTLYEGEGEGDFTIDISEVVQTAFQDPPSNPDNIQATGIITTVPRHVRKVRINASDAQCSDQLQWNILFGGTNKGVFRRLRKLGTDFVAQRIRNYQGNFFLTTRSDTWLIPIRETEVMPLAFICPSNDITIVEPLTAKQWEYTPPTGGDGMYALLDIERLRRWFYTTHGIIASIFDVYVSGQLACRIVITRAPLARQRYPIRFLNSYGAWEMVDMADEATLSPSLPEEQTLQRWDADTAAFYTHRERVNITRILSLHSGYADATRLRWLLDMVASQHVYVRIHDAWVKAIPTIDETSIPLRAIEPQDLAVQLTLADDECHITGDVGVGTSQPPRIHTTQFNPPFN